MEYTQWVTTTNSIHSPKNSLNPCCNGIYSMRRGLFSKREGTWKRLNPCCNGIYSMRLSDKQRLQSFQRVLILVVMEYTQWVYTTKGLGISEFQS